MVINEDWENSAKLEDKVAEGEFIAGQLLQIVSGYDLFDDAGKLEIKNCKARSSFQENFADE